MIIPCYCLMLSKFYADCVFNQKPILPQELFWSKVNHCEGYTQYPLQISSGVEMKMRSSPKDKVGIFWNPLLSKGNYLRIWYKPLLFNEDSII